MSLEKQPEFMRLVTTQRYFSYSRFLTVINELLSEFRKDKFEFVEIGKSVLKNPIYKLTVGTGSTKILMWSQMHGNESTTTRSLLPFINWFMKSQHSSIFTLCIIPVLNPDGLTAWTRENANNVDLNRDAQDLSQPESLLLKTTFDSFQPDYCFNLHDQRTIYGTPDGTQAVECSFLSPAANESREITPERIKSMNVIQHIVEHIKEKTIGVIGRYNDTFNINCVGDTFQSLGVPTVLFEAGQANTDYYRSNTVELMFNSLQSALECIAANDSKPQEEMIQAYHAITPISTNFCDIWIKNVSSGNRVVDLSVMYKEVVKEDVLYFIPILSGINDVTVKNAHRIIDLELSNELVDFEVSKGQKFTSNNLDIHIFY
ncbi:MAG: M14 family zinc carboxypeptidase [Nonlabens sp.]|uniref:M14 family zinc carboxypeptidase n=1 Tax=Nonlabens sp. TaxID=1888209 RepID=UPI003EF46435